jgi:PAS domain S-box-containing protein
MSGGSSLKSDPAWIRPISAILAKTEAWRSRAPLWSSLGVGASAAAAGALIRLALLGGSTTKLAFLTFYPVVVIAALVGGGLGGSLAVVFSALLVHAVFVPLTSTPEWLALAIFAISSFIVVAITQMLLVTRASLLAAEASQAVQARFAAIVESSSDAILSKTLDGTITSWNTAATRLLGYGAEEMIGQPVTRLIPTALVEEENRTVARIRNGETIDHYETVRVAKDGSRRDVSVTVSPIKDDRGQIVGASKVIRDVIARKLAVRAVRENEEKFRNTFANAAIGCATAIPEGTFIDANPAYCRLTGYGMDELRSMDFSRIIHPDYRAAYMASIARLLAGAIPGFVIETRCLRKDGGTIWARKSVSASNDATGQPKWIITLVEDITERKKSEDALRESEEKFRNTFANAAIGFATTIPDGALIDANPAYCRLTGYGLDELRSMDFSRLIHPDDRAENMALIASMLASDIPGFVIENRYLRKDGAVIWVRKSVSATSDAAGKAKWIINLVEDVTERKMADAALAAAKVEADRANRAKSKFLAAASHDLRQPVQSLLLLQSIAERQFAANPAGQKTVTMMKAAVQGLNGLLTGVLDLSRLDAGVVDAAMECVDLGALVCRLTTEYEPKAASAGLELRQVPRRSRVRTDPVLLERMLRNLIENALRYTAKGGVLIGVRRRGECVRIDVIDTGIGISADKHTEIFEEFHQLNNPGRDLGQGLGLGLAIVGRFANLLSAQIEVASKVGRGSRFSVSLPLAHDGAQTATEQSVLKDPGGRVLIVEDAAILLHGLEGILHEWGYETLVAATGEEAVDLAAKEDWRFELIIADHQLGAALTGVATAKEIERQAKRAFPTLVLTGDTEKEKIAEIDACGFDMLHKPVAADVLRRKLAQMLSP